MGASKLIDSHVSSAQCDKAVSALVGHATKIAKRKEEHELLPGKEENLWIVVSVKKVTPEKKLKAHKIPLAHPIIDPRTTSVCLITKDPQREYKDLLAAQNVKFINRVVGIEKLKGKWKPFEARRMLMKESGMFLADERVIPLLPRLLGKIFFEAKKQPIPVSLTKKDVKTELEQAVSSTYMHQNAGSCTSIKFGTISQSPKQLVANLQTALPAIVKRIEGGWSNIQSLHIKTNSSTSLPIWTCELAEGENGRWTTSKKDAEEAPDGSWGGFDAADGSDSEKLDAPVHPIAKTEKGKNKRSVEEEDGVASKSRKLGQSGSSKSAPKEAPASLKESSKKEFKSKLNRSELASKQSVDSPATSNTPKKKSSKEKLKPSPSESQTIVSKPKVHFNTDITSKEMKQKKAGSSLEKKKAKVTEGKMSGGFKEGLVGKKSKSRI